MIFKQTKRTSFLRSAAIEAVGRKGCYIFADVSQETEVEEMISKVVEELGGLDVVRSAVACRKRDLISPRWSATLDIHYEVFFR